MKGLSDKLYGEEIVERQKEQRKVTKKVSSRKKGRAITRKKTKK